MVYFARFGCRHARTPSHNFAVSKSLTLSLPWAAWHSKGGRTPIHTMRGPRPERVTGRVAASARAPNASSTRRPGLALERNAPNLLADYLYLSETTAVRQAIETARTS